MPCRFHPSSRMRACPRRRRRCLRRPVHSRPRLSARCTSSAETGRERMALSHPSFVSPTTGLMDTTFCIPGWASISATSASAARQTHSVHVSRMGVSSSPNSSTCVAPISLPNALPTYTAAGTRSRNMLPACGRMAVTPVWTESPCVIVTCPTSTPCTSVMPSSGPGWKIPGFTPRARARARVACARSAGAGVSTARQASAPRTAWRVRYGTSAGIVRVSSKMFNGSERIRPTGGFETRPTRRAAWIGA